MREVIDDLSKTGADSVVLAEVYETIYTDEQTRMLKQVGELVDLFYREGVWTLSKVGIPQCDKDLAPRHNLLVNVASDLLKSDPVTAYITLLNEIRRAQDSLSTLQGTAQQCASVYVRTLEFVRAGFERLELIQRTKQIISKLGKLPEGRGIYRTLFETQIKPAFVSSRVFFATPKEIELVDQYIVQDATVNIYRHPEKIQYMYYINPPEYNLTPEKYFLLSKTRELVATFHPEGIMFMNPSEVKRYFTRIYETTISDLAAKNNIQLTGREKEELAKIVARYTVGFGMMELILSDRRLTDVYMDAPLGNKPIYVMHSEYGSCQTNVVFTEDEAKGIISRFRAMSGRPFDEAHPVLDFDLADLQTRVCVIGPPLSPDGTAFALRLHKETPWTLPQFIDVKMMNSLSAGLLSFLIDAQASTLVNGSRGSGKTSMLQALMLEILPSLRIIVQEDTLEIPVPFMKMLGYNIQRLKTQSAIAVSRTSAEVAPEEALRTALRLGDSVLIVGEVRSTEAKVLYEAMRVGAVGNVVMGTIHGESAYSVWDRIVNDLGVPNTSFKATDIVVTSAPIRFKGSLKKNRRLVEITEVGKHWYEDPEKEGGLIDLLGFDVAKDAHYIIEDNLKRSEMFPRIAAKRGLKISELWDDIYARADTKQFVVDMKNKYGIPELLEAKFTVPANDKWLLTLEKSREQYGKVNWPEAKELWKAWVMEEQVKPLVSRREAIERAKKAGTP
jgi:type IV secretory pathway ATPase VirB11/archaellum biosynthesis ATPase